MKKTLICMLALLMLISAALTACGGGKDAPSGTYTCAFSGKEIIVTFNGDKFTISMTMTGEKEEYSGTYTLDGSKITLKADGEDKLLKGTYNAKEDTLELSDSRTALTFTKK